MIILGWTDRIFFKTFKSSTSNFSLDLIEYNCMRDISFSDHKPIYAYFDFNIINYF